MAPITLLKPDFLFLNIVSFLELVYASAGINQLLLAGKERMTLVADIHLQGFYLFGSAGLKGRAASAYNRYFVIIGMYFGLHLSHLAVIFCNAKLLYIKKSNKSIIFPPRLKIFAFNYKLTIFCIKGLI